MISDNLDPAKTPVYVAEVGRTDPDVIKSMFHLRNRDAERAELASAIARYKALRDRLHRGLVWQGEAGDGVLWQAHGDTTHLLALITRTRPTTQRHQPRLRLPMLRPDQRYRIHAEGADVWEVDGAWAIRSVLPLPPMQGEEVQVWQIDAV